MTFLQTRVSFGNKLWATLVLTAVVVKCDYPKKRFNAQLVCC